MIKTLSEVGIKGTYLNILMAKKKKERKKRNIILNSEKLKDFPLRSRARQECLLLPILFNRVLEVLVITIRQGKGGWDGKGGEMGVQDGEHMYTHGGFM